VNKAREQQEALKRKEIEAKQESAPADLRLAA
jgi:hypothetical protein